MVKCQQSWAFFKLRSARIAEHCRNENAVLKQCKQPLVIPLLPPGDLELTLDRTNWKFGVSDINFLILGVYFRGIRVMLQE